MGIAYASTRKRNERFFHGSPARNLYSHFIPDRNRPILNTVAIACMKRTDYTSLAPSVSVCRRLAASHLRLQKTYCCDNTSI